MYFDRMQRKHNFFQENIYFNAVSISLVPRSSVDQLQFIFIKSKPRSKTLFNVLKINIKQFG